MFVACPHGNSEGQIGEVELSNTINRKKPAKKTHINTQLWRRKQAPALQHVGKDILGQGLLPP